MLRKVNRQLEEPLVAGSADLLTVGARESAAMPVASTVSLAPVVERWSETVAEGGHDLRGDLSTLLDVGAGTPLPGPRDQLGVAVDTLADALADNSRLRAVVADLEADRDRLDRKRRKLKRRLKRAAAPAR